MKKLIKLFYLDYSCKNLVEKSNKENLKVIKKYFSGNPESLSNNHSSWKALQSTIFGEDFLRAFYKLVCLRFCISRDQ